MDSFFTSSKINRTVQVDGKEYLYFSGTAYLGMSALPTFEVMVWAGIQRYGVNYGASRKSNVQLSVYAELEDRFAGGAGAESAVVVSSGFMAGHLTVTVLQEIVDLVWVAPGAHPAILPDELVSERSKTFSHFSQQCIDESHEFEGKTVAILADTLDILKPAIHDFGWTRDLSEKNQYYLLLDDSHAFGLLGEDVFGSYSKWATLPVQLVVAGAMGKALSIPAGIILGPDDFVQKILSHPKFIGASPPAPGFCQAFLDAQSLYSYQQRKLRQNCRYFFSSIGDLEGLNYERNLPIVTFAQSGWAAKLQEEQLLISSFPYPNPTDSALDRIILSASHEKDDLDKLIHTMRRITFP